MKQVVLSSILFVFFGACVGAFRSAQRDGMLWERVGPNLYRYSDNHLALELKVGPGQKFHWRIKNLSILPLEIDQGQIFLRRVGDPIKYAIWGAPHREDIPQGLLKIPPDGFVAISYPIQYTSPFFPFNIAEEGGVWLEFTSHWKFQSSSYHLGFPAEPNK